MPNQAVEILKALADEHRLDIVRAIASQEDEKAACAVIQACPKLAAMSQPTQSHHLAKLVDAGVLAERKEGTRKWYSLDRARLARFGIDVASLTS